MKKKSLSLMPFSFGHIALAWEPPRGEEQALMNNLIITNEPFWRHTYPGLIYTSLLLTLAVITLRNLSLKKQQKKLESKVRVFTDALHDMHLTLIRLKKPLEKLRTEKTLTQEDTANINTTLHNVNILLNMTNDFTAIEKADTYASKTEFPENVMNTCANGITEEEILKNGTSMNWEFITNVRNHVEENIDNQQFNVDMLCSLMGMSRTSFYNKLKSLTDKAPADYIRLIRLEYAIRLLGEGEHNITEISEMTGFNDARYFRQVFKKYFKISPSQYGKKIREHR